MELLTKVVQFIFPDGLIYLLTAIVFLVGIIKCCRPVYRNAASLRRARDLLKEGAKAKLGRPVWSEQGFLGKHLQPVWRAYLQSAEMGAASGVSSDVAEYIDDAAIIDEPGNASLADVIPGLCTSLGILGTFIGLVMGLSGLDFMNPDSAVQLTNGISFAFITSIVGIIASFVFNVIYRIGIGKAREAIDTFVAAFYQHGIPKPPDAATQMLTYEREQADAMGQFARDMSVQLAGEIQHAIMNAMEPVQRSMNDFLRAATRAQMEGLDNIVDRFVQKMNASLDDQLSNMAVALKETAEGQMHAQEKLRKVVDSISSITREVLEIHDASEKITAKFTAYIDDMGDAYRQMGDTQADAGELLEEIAEAAERQAKYLSALQDYQTKLQASFQDYTIWTDKYVGGLEESTNAQSISLEHISQEMRSSGELLQGAYKTFTESVELGLANALGLFDENMQNLMRQVNGTLGDVEKTITRLEKTLNHEKPQAEEAQTQEVT